MTPHEAATPIKSARSSSKSERWLASGKWRGSKLEEFFFVSWLNYNRAKSLPSAPK